MHTEITQPAQNNQGTSTAGPVKVITFGTYRRPSKDFQWTNTKLYGL